MADEAPAKPNAADLDEVTIALAKRLAREKFARLKFADETTEKKP